MTEIKTVTKKRNQIIPRTKPLVIAPKKRPSNPLNKWIKETKNSYQITRKDICYIYRNIIFTKTFGELKEIMNDIEKQEKLPVLVVTIISSVLGDIARGNLLNLTRMLQFVFPDAMKGFNPDEFASNAGKNGYDEIQELEDAIRRLEGDDGIMIVDKLIKAEGDYKIISEDKK